VIETPNERLLNRHSADSLPAALETHAHENEHSLETQHSQPQRALLPNA